MSSLTSLSYHTSCILKDENYKRFTMVKTVATVGPGSDSYKCLIFVQPKCRAALVLGKLSRSQALSCTLISDFLKSLLCC